MNTEEPKPDVDQTPPPDYEPQEPLAPSQDGGLTERPPDLISDAESEDPDDQPETDGVAAEDDDDADDGD